MSDDSENGGGSLIGTLLTVIVIVVASVFALKVTFWAFKSLLWLAVVGGVGYVAYSLIRGRLTSDKKSTERKLLTSSSSASSPSSEEDEEEDALKAFDEALRELEQLKRDRGE